MDVLISLKLIIYLIDILELRVFKFICFTGMNIACTVGIKIIILP